MSLHALGVGAMAGIAGHDVGFRNSLHDKLFFPCAARSLSPSLAGFRRDRCKIDCQIAGRIGNREPPPRPTYIVSKTDCLACARGNSEAGSRCIAASVRPVVARPYSPVPMFRGTRCNCGRRRFSPSPAHAGAVEATIARIAILNPMRFMTPSFRALCAHRDGDRLEIASLTADNSHRPRRLRPATSSGCAPSAP